MLEVGKGVTPLAGVWVEIGWQSICDTTEQIVTPLAGVWVEIIYRNTKYD